MICKLFEFEKLKFENFHLFLFYGKNTGSQNEIVEKYFTNKFEGEINSYDENDFINNSETIISEILNKSLFDNKKIIIVSRVTDKVFKICEDLSNRELIDIKIILKSGVLDKKSKLRNLFEKSRRLITIPFYEDDFRNLNSIIMKFTNENKIKLSRESINLIIDRANGDRESLNNELNKILSFSYTNKKIEYENIEKLTNQNENFGVNYLADNVLLKNKKRIARILNENNYSNDDCILILRAILNKSKRLLSIISRYREEDNLDELISKTKPPIFWKEKNNVKNQVKSWKIEDLKKKIYEINEIELIIKKNSTNSLNIVSDFIVNY